MKKLVIIILCILLSLSYVSAYKVYYYHNDQLGNPVALTNEQGEVVWKAEYKPFGEIFDEENIEINNKYNYNTKELDENTNLLYYGARYYDADIGRFTTADTIKGSLESPQSLNKYSYTLNNPMKFIDPSGNEEEPSEARLRAYNFCISAGMCMINGIARGDPIKDIVKNSLIAGGAGVASFETKRLTGMRNYNLATNVASDIANSIRTNAMQNKPALSSISINYGPLIFTSSDDPRISIDVGKVSDIIEFALTHGNKFDVSKTMSTGVPTFVRNEIGESILTGYGGYSGAAGPFGGAISYTKYKGYLNYPLHILSHEYIHSIQSKESASLYTGLESPSSTSVLGVPLDFSSIGGAFISYYAPMLMYGATHHLSSIESYGPGYYYSDLAWQEREASSLAK